jgi:hypothetical protein
MATLAADILNRFTATKTLERVEEQTGNPSNDPYLIRPIAGEDIIFFSKYVDNARMVRRSDPKTRRSQSWAIAGSLGAAVLLVALMLPTLYSAFYGYQVETLRQEQAKLTAEIASLNLQEEKILSPARIEELSKKQSFVDPDPSKIIYLEGKHDSVAKGITPPAKDQVR